ncbi:MAG: ABC transporter permease [Ignavibacteria bacterium]|nr:ABC transporter permease [Ignavibacteria bacterium]MBP6509700.1 ABC transporter permease [Candidatus Kapabacteria bacterium]MBK6418937.1 ABC transporter permease [Ignavibacteria bacterium]MBK6760374.1 ABC transporter permease [Ignavibacteria bacterium]MBK7033872.1 ABC transporter permease [Ignavibacteria bacterium]
MRTLLFLLQKEFLQIFRDRIILAMILIMPTMQLILLPLAANYEVRHIGVSIVDHDRSAMSHQLIMKITATDYFDLVRYTGSYPEALQLIESNQTDVILEIPAGFERSLVRENEQTLFISTNAINGVKANIGAAYLNRIIMDFNSGVRADLLVDAKGLAQPLIDVRTIDRFNPHLLYHVFMVPGILALLLTMISVYLSALNIVREKELGTIEQINVTPITRLQFISGKLIPFWLLGFVTLTIGLLVARFVYGIVPVGNIGLIYLFSGVYLTAVLGLGLLISTVAETQQQAMFVAFFFMMIFIMMGGLFTSIESMPMWAQWLTYLNPVRYIIEVMRLVILKGAGLSEIRFHFLVVAAMAVVLNTWAVLKYRKMA